MWGEAALAIHWGGSWLALWAAGRRLHLPGGRRLIFISLFAAAAGLGAGFLPPWARWGMLLLLPLLMCRAAWPRLRSGAWLTAWAWTLGAGLLLSGGGELLFQQGVPAPLALLGAAGALILGLILVKAPPPPDSRCTRVEITLAGMRLTLPAMVDTGNLLTDPVTGLPVIVCSRQALSTAVWLPEGIDTLPPGFRLLPVRTCAGRGLMVCTRPQALCLEGPEGWRCCQALVGIAPAPYKGMQALVPACLLHHAAE